MKWDAEIKLTLAGCLLITVFALGLMYQRNLDLQDELDTLRNYAVFYATSEDMSTE